MRTRTTASTSRALYPSARLVSDYLEGGGVIENGEIGETEGRGREEGTTDKRGGEGREKAEGMLMNEMELQPSLVPLNMTFDLGTNFPVVT